MSNVSEYIIYSRKMAVKLRQAGHRILRTEVNEHKPELDCYVFEDTEQFRITLSQLSRGGRSNER